MSAPIAPSGADARRFWTHVNKNGPVNAAVGTPCWTWQAYHNRKGYGVSGTRRNAHLAHRMAWAIEHTDPGEAIVMHLCDNRRCVRPDHLRLGTHQDNMTDMVNKNRHVPCPGEDTESKLTEADVLAIRAIGRAEPLRVLAARYGVSKVMISYVLLGRSWKHVGGPRVQQARRKLTDADIQTITQTPKKYGVQKELAQQLGVDPSTICHLLQKHGA